MPLICFIENAFKHGTCTAENCFVDIDITVNNNKLDFLVKNSIPGKQKNIVSTKIGLKNTRERLNLLYGNDYKLNIEENGTYTVSLELKLKRL